MGRVSGFDQFENNQIPVAWSASCRSNGCDWHRCRSAKNEIQVKTHRKSCDRLPSKMPHGRPLPERREDPGADCHDSQPGCPSNLHHRTPDSFPKRKKKKKKTLQERADEGRGFDKWLISRRVWLLQAGECLQTGAFEVFRLHGPTSPSEAFKSSAYQPCRHGENPSYRTG